MVRGLRSYRRQPPPRWPRKSAAGWSGKRTTNRYRRRTVGTRPLSLVRWCDGCSSKTATRPRTTTPTTRPPAQPLWTARLKGVSDSLIWPSGHDVMLFPNTQPTPHHESLPERPDGACLVSSASALTPLPHATSARHFRMTPLPDPKERGVRHREISLLRERKVNKEGLSDIIRRRLPNRLNSVRQTTPPRSGLLEQIDCISIGSRPRFHWAFQNQPVIVILVIDSLPSTAGDSTLWRSELISKHAESWTS